MKYSFVFVLIVFSTISLHAKEIGTGTENADSLAIQSDTIVSLATSLLGVPYRYGGITPGQGFDCSGFVKFVFSNFGFDIPRTTVEMADFGEEIHLDSCKKGDIISVLRKRQEKATNWSCWNYHQ